MTETIVHSTGKTTGDDRRLGDPAPREMLERFLRVNHAGEYGAVRIYEGQRAILGKTKAGPMLKHMAEQEEVHLETFEKEIADRRIRPTLFQPIWHVAGFALGAGTALLGEKAAMACTVAVETVIDEHYADQVKALGDDEAELRDTCEKFRQEEVEHKDLGLEHGAEQAPGYEVLTGAIKAGSKLAIWLSSRL
ncbi:MAG: demethoxyubiquinone hydroxylase family protein [Magnetovibrionaceae bacterium]